MYFDSRVVIGLLVITLVMVVVSLLQRNIPRALLFGGLCALSIHIGLATLATKDMIEDYRASIDDGSLHALSGFAALPSWVFGMWVWIGVGLLAAWLATSLVMRARGRRQPTASNSLVDAF